MADPQIQSLARRLRNLERQALLAKQPTLGFSSIDDGAITAVDQDQNLTMVIGKQFDQTSTAAVITGPTPPQPLLPLVTEEVGTVRIYWDGTFTDGEVAPMDFARVLAYAEPLASYNGPEPTNAALIIGSFSSATGGEMTAALTPGVEYAIYLVCWTQAGKFGPASDVALATPGEVPDAEPSDGVAPASSPEAIVKPALGAVAITWTPISNPDPVTYDVYGQRQWANNGDETIHSTELELLGSAVGSGPVFVRSIAGERLRPEGQLEDDEFSFGYYFQVVARDADGEAPGGSFGFGFPAQATSGEIAPQSILTEHLTVGSVLGDHLQFGTLKGQHFQAEITLSSKFVAAHVDEATGEIQGRRVELSPDGIELINVDETIAVQIPTNPETKSTFRGHVETDSLRVLGGTSIESTTNEIARDAVLTLSQGTADPIAGPTVSNTWPQITLDTTTTYGPSAAGGGLPSGGLGIFALDPAEITAFGWHAGHGCWLVAQRRPGGTRIWRIDPFTGAPIDPLNPGGPPRIDDNGNQDKVTAVWQHDPERIDHCSFFRAGSDWWLDAPGPNGLATLNLFSPGWRLNPDRDPVAAFDPNTGQYAIAEMVISGSNAGKMVVRRFNTVNTAFGALAHQSNLILGANTGIGTQLTSFHIGENFDFNSTDKIVWSDHQYGQARVANVSAGAQRDPDFEWQTGGAIKGLAWDGFAWHSVTGDGVIRAYGGHEPGPASQTLNTALTWYDSDPAGTVTPPASDGKHETALGARTVSTRWRRAQTRVTLPAVPDGGSVDDPDSVRLYVSLGTTDPAPGDFHLQYTGGWAAGSTPITLSGISDSGAPPPAVNNFPGANPGRFRSAKTNGTDPIIELRGDGAGQVGHVKWTDTGANANDSGWVTLSTTASATGLAQIRKIDHQVWFKGTLTPSGGGDFAGGAVVTVVAAGGVPANMRPTIRSEAQLTGNSAAKSVRGYVEANGAIVFVTAPSPNNPASVSLAGLSCIYLVD